MSDGTIATQVRVAFGCETMLCRQKCTQLLVARWRATTSAHPAANRLARNSRAAGFGCWLSGVDVNTAQSFEQLNPRSVAVVVDPIQSVKGKVVIDAFRCISPQLMMMGQEPRQTTSVVGHLNKPSIQALIHGLNRHYYSIPIAYRKNELETKMLMNLHKRKWTKGLALTQFNEQVASNEALVADMAAQAEAYAKRVADEEGKTPTEIAVMTVGKVDPKKRLEGAVQQLMTANIGQSLGAMLDTVVF